MRDIQSDHQEGDRIVLGSAMWWPYHNWYAPRMGLPDGDDPQGLVTLPLPRDPADAYADQLRATLADASQHGQRVWVLAADGIWMGHHPKWPTLGDLHDTRAPTRQVLEQLGTIQAQHDYANVSVYLWGADEYQDEQ